MPKKATKKTATKKAIPHAPLPAPRQAPAPKPTARAVVSDGPTRADYEALQKRCEDLLERGRKVSAERDAQSAKADELAEENKLLQAGVDPSWTDRAVRGAFAAVELEGGVLGACIAVLEAQRLAAIAESELLEETGEREQALSAIGAARRLRKVKQTIADIHKEAQGMEPMDRSIKRASKHIMR